MDEVMVDVRSIDRFASWESCYSVHIYEVDLFLEEGDKTGCERCQNPCDYITVYIYWQKFVCDRV